ncbi:MAG: APC family permease [Legionellales bacterium]|nr:APC family permease [Legionellales bacterium]
MKMQRVIGRTSLLFISVGAMIGSGWMFGPLYAAQIAGPASIITWILGGILVFIVALSFAELSTTLPVTGGIARFPQFTHGSLVSYTMTFIAWLAYVLLAPIEIQALLQYAAHYLPGLIHSVDGKPALSHLGLLIAAGLLFIMSGLNILGIKAVSRFNTLLVWLKILIPLFTVLVLLHVSKNFNNFHTHEGFVPDGLKGILTALPMAGVVFSFFGFRVSIEVAGEAKNPQQALPIALLGSITICIIIYTLVQFAFISALPPTFLHNGFAQLTFQGDEGPLVGLAASFGLNWLVIILFADAFYSPFGSALIVVTTTARLDYAMAENGYVPKFLSRLNQKGVPYWAILVNFVVGAILLLPFPGWQTLAGFILAALVFSHAIAPVSLIALRKQLPALNRPFKLPYALPFCFLAFYILNMIGYWTGWQTISKMYLAAGIGFIILIVYRLYQIKQQLPRPDLHLQQGYWLILYFGGMGIISYLGNFGGGLGYIHFGMDFIIIGVFSLITFYVGLHQALPAHETAQQIAREQSLQGLIDHNQLQT